MAISPITPRDRLQRLVDLGRKTMRYWWLVAVFAVVGGGLSLAFAMTRQHTYQSWTTLFYQEKIQSSVFSQQREDTAQRNIGDRYRELLLARDQLLQIIADPKINPYPDQPDPEDAIDKLRQAVKFEARGANAFRISYTDGDPQRAKDVTERLFQLLDAKDDKLRKEQAEFTVAFAQKQSSEATADVNKREQALAQFLALHPEFAQDPNTATDMSHGRTPKPQAPTTTTNARVLALQRQRARLQARLDAPADAAPVQLPAPPTPEKIAAEQAVADAQREVSAAQRELDDANQKYQDKHPTVIRAQERLAAATQKLRHAQGNVPPDVIVEVKPATGEDRVKLQRQIQELDQEIVSESGSSSRPTPVTPTNDSTTKIVKLETDYAEIRRTVNEARGRAEALAGALFRAQMDASQKSAESGGRLTVVDAAFKPVRPIGAGKTIILMAGMVLFLSLGLALAVGMAVIDDRLYRRIDIDQLGLPVLAVIPPDLKRKST
jgi:uncharacterized protein involved in exopolysaccharide biosynthesis